MPSTMYCANTYSMYLVYVHTHVPYESSTDHGSSTDQHTHEQGIVHTFGLCHLKGSGHDTTTATVNVTAICLEPR